MVRVSVKAVQVKNAGRDFKGLKLLNRPALLPSSPGRLQQFFPGRNAGVF